MEHEIYKAVARTGSDNPRNSRELVESIYNELDIPMSKRESHYSAVVSRIRQFCRQQCIPSLVTPTDQRPQSLCSNRSSAHSAHLSTSNTEYSTASSRTSCCSSFAKETFHEPADLSTHANGSSSDSAQILLPDTAPSPTIDPRSVVNVPRVSGSANGYVCPWCNVSSSKLFDFKRHVKNYCCGRRLWICRNCTHSAYQKYQANEHRFHGGNPKCRQRGWINIDLDCDRKHFGCSYCATYFDNLDKYLHHLGKECGPGRSESRSHQSSRIAGLLQQPAIRSLAEALSLEMRNSRQAYMRLHWCWKERYMAEIVQQLEYGPKARVDIRNPGIAADHLYGFLKFLITPSDGSRDLVEFAREFAHSNSLRQSACKPLPSLPESDNIPSVVVHEPQLQAESHVDVSRSPDEPPVDDLTTLQTVEDPSLDAASRSGAAADGKIDFHVIKARPSCLSGLQQNTSDMDVSNFLHEDFQLTWDRLADTICSDPVIAAPWNRMAVTYDEFSSSDVIMEMATSGNAEEPSTVQHAEEFVEFDLIG